MVEKAGGAPGGGSPNKFALTVVVTGDPVSVEVNINAPVHTLVNEALRLSKNTGRPLPDWRLTDEEGNELAFDAKLNSYPLAAGALLFLSLRAGEAG